MMNNYDIVRQLSIALPCELHIIILREYMKRYVIKEMLQSPLRLRKLEICKAHSQLSTSIEDYVNKVSQLLQEGEICLQMSLDIVEDRVLTDDWFAWDQSQQSLRVIDITRSVLLYPSKLKIELEAFVYLQVKQVTQVQCLTNNLSMLTKML